MKTKFLLIFLCVVATMHAQQNNKMCPALQLKMYEQNQRARSGLKSSQNEIINAIIWYQGNTIPIENLGVKIRTKTNQFLTATFPLELLDTLSTLSCVKGIEQGSKCDFLLDQSVKHIKADVCKGTFKKHGDGVIIGFVDSGIDPKHPTFNDKNGNTRIIYLWDQDATGGSTPGGEFNYGREWLQSQISGSTHIESENGHGTSVASIAVGNGKSTMGNTPYDGIADESEIIVVATAVPTSDKVIDGVNYIANRAKAKGKPWVANLSLGSRKGPRNGSSLFERTITEIANDITKGEGRIIICGAGNEGFTTELLSYNDILWLNNRIHISGYGADSKTLLVNLINDNYHMEQVQIYIYMPEFSNYSFSITGPSGKTYPADDLDDGREVIENGGLYAKGTFDGWISALSMEVDYFEEGNQEIFMLTINDWDPDSDGVMNAQMRSGNWKINLHDGSGQWDGYIVYRDEKLQEQGAYFSDEPYSNINCIREPGNSPGVITVGSYNSKNSWSAYPCDLNYPEYPDTKTGAYSSAYRWNIKEETFTSSRGPSRDGVPKPDLLAPGRAIACAKNRSIANCDDINLNTLNHDYWIKEGTSMAAPHVSGTVALIMENILDKGAEITFDHIYQCLTKKDLKSSGTPMLDANAALNYSNQLLNSTCWDCGFYELEEFSANGHVKLYPNPATDYITVESREGLTGKIEIINLAGQTVLTSFNQENTIGVRHLPNGLYTPTWTSQNQKGKKL